MKHFVEATDEAGNRYSIPISKLNYFNSLIAQIEDIEPYSEDFYALTDEVNEKFSEYRI